jgi:hypothetical protein
MGLGGSSSLAAYRRRKPMKANRILLLLAIVLISFLAAPKAHAASELPVSNESELLSAIASAADGDVIRLTDSITCTSTITVQSKSITFNLDGNNLNVITDSDTALDVKSGGVALVGTGELNVNGKYCGVLAQSSTVTVTNATAREYYRSARPAVLCSNGSVTVRKNVIHTGRYGRGIIAYSGSKVEVLGDVTVTANNSLAIDADATYEGTSVTVHGNCQAIGAPSFCGVSVQNKATVTVNGVLSSTGYFVGAYMTLLTASEGVAGEAPYENYRIYFRPGSNQTVVRIQNHGPVAKSPMPTLSIISGTSAVVGGSDLATDVDSSDTLTITEIVSEPDSTVAAAVLSEGSIHISAAMPGNTSISVVIRDAFSAATIVTIPVNVPAVCSIGETGYPELADALIAAKDGDEIKLLDSISVNNFSVSGKEVSLNLNGYTLSVGGINAAEVGNGGRLTILGAGTFTATGAKYGIYVHDAGVFNFSGTGTFTLSGRERCVYADGEGSSVSVPSVEQIESSGVGVYAAAGATINVTGNVNAAGAYSTCVNAAGGIITVSGNVLNSGDGGKAVRASTGGRVTVNGSVMGTKSYNYVAYAESGGSITVGGPVFGDSAAYADGIGSKITAVNSVVSIQGLGAVAKNNAVISVGMDITGGEARAESGGKITVGRDIVSTGAIQSYGATAAGSGSSVEVAGNVSASGGIVSVGANAKEGGTVIIRGSITGVTGSMLSCGAWADVGTIRVDGTIKSSGIYIRTVAVEKTAADYTLGTPPYENYKIYQTGSSIVQVRIPTVIKSVTADTAALPESGGIVTVTLSGYSIPTGATVAAFDENGEAIGITGLTTGGVNVQTAMLTFAANTERTEKTYTIKASLNGGTTWSEITATVTIAPMTVIEHPYPDPDSDPDPDREISTHVSPQYFADMKTESGWTTLPAMVNNGTVSVIGASLMPRSGGTVIQVPTIPGIDTYSVNILVSNLSATGGQGTLTFNTDAGSITIESNMLTDVSGLSGIRAEITIGRGDKSRLPDDLKTAIGDRPLIQLTLSIDGTQTPWSNPDAPVTVSVPHTPTPEELANPEGLVIWYIDGSGNAACVTNGRYNPETGTVTFSTTHFSYYAVVYHPVSFLDMDEGAWYYKAVNYLAARDITNGTGDGSFSPDAKLTRGQFIVLLMRTYGIESDEKPADNFSDAGSSYYTGYLAAAKRLNLADGIGNNQYAPEREITRQEMFTLLHNVLKSINRLPQGDSFKTISDFSDAGQIQPWAKDAVKLLAETGIVEGTAGKLYPTGTATRAEITQVFYKLEYLMR